MIVYSPAKRRMIKYADEPTKRTTDKVAFESVIAADKRDIRTSKSSNRE